VGWRAWPAASGVGLSFASRFCGRLSPVFGQPGLLLSGQQGGNGRLRGKVPPATTRVTAFIDVHDKLLFWCVCAWE
jgi:hypothetical protein